MFQDKKILFIGSHPDDIELGAGATISNLKQKNKLLCLTLSKNQNNPDNKFQNRHLLKEQEKALTTLGILKKNIIVADFKTRTFSYARQEICEYLLKIRKDYNPDIIITHSLKDIHQDHEVVISEVLRIFREQTIFGYETLRSSFHFQGNFFFEVTSVDVEKKIRALKCYRTYKDKKYFVTDVIKAQLIKNGLMIGVRFAEGFEVIRLVQRSA